MSIYRKQAEVPFYPKQMTKEEEMKSAKGADAIAILIAFLIPSGLLMMMGFFWEMMTTPLHITSALTAALISISALMAIGSIRGWWSYSK